MGLPLLAFQDFCVKIHSFPQRVIVWKDPYTDTIILDDVCKESYIIWDRNGRAKAAASKVSLLLLKTILHLYRNILS